ncbi:MAG: tail fiber domain-containing protein [Acidobacteriota bacterium]
MKNTSKTFRTCAVALALSMTASAGFAAPAPSFDANSLGSGLSFNTSFIYGSSTLRVVGPEGFVFEQQFTKSDDLSFDFDGIPADGSYYWEVLVVSEIDDALRAKLNEGQAAGDFGIVDRVKASGELQSHTYFGSFKVEGGVVQMPTQNSSADDRDISLKAQVFTQDLIVEGSTCLGVDCSSTESFGFDTLRIKENNVRLHFEDTSTTGNFPGNDWRISINDSSNNGDNYYSVQDATANTTPFRIDAGAPSNSIRVDSDGNLGIGTSNPVVQVHAVDGNSPALRLEQDGSAGFQTQIWDLAGNETNFFLRDVTNSSKLPFRVRPGAPDDSIYIAADGNVGLGTDAPKTGLHLLGGGSVYTPENDKVIALFQNNADAADGSIVSVISGNGNANAQVFLGDVDDENAGRITYRNGSDTLGFAAGGQESVRLFSDKTLCLGGCTATTGNAIQHENGASLSAAGVWTNTSSRERKQDIESLSADAATSALKNLEPVTYRYLAELDETYVGFIAEDVPDLVAMNGRKSMNSMDVVAVLTRVVQEQQKAIEALTERLESLDVE